MPTYDYRCTGCGHSFDVRQRFDEEPVLTCPRCHQNVRRVMHVPAIIYKGSGFYTTDYKNFHASAPSHSRDDATSDESSKSDEPSKKEKSPEAKPAEAATGNATKGESHKESVSGKA